jgi:hypothetical protein
LAIFSFSHCGSSSGASQTALRAVVAMSYRSRSFTTLDMVAPRQPRGSRMKPSAICVRDSMRPT